MNELETWAPIPSYPGYEASNFGQIRSWCWTINRRHREMAEFPKRKTVRINENGYCIVGIGHRISRRVHVLVAEAFIGAKPYKMDVNHIDGNKQNNRVDNLEYLSRSDNHRHAFKLGLAKSPFTGVHGDAHRNTKISDADVKLLREQFSNGVSRRALATQYGISYYTVWDITTGRSRSNT
jgi:hypothetical protein